MVDISQSQELYARLRVLYGSNAETRLQLNLDKLNAEHDDNLRGDEYVNIVKDFVLADCSW